MSPCPACEAAEPDPVRGGVHFADCLGCEARRLANHPAAGRAMRGDGADLIAEIEKVWVNDVDAGRAAVWAWIKRINNWKASQC